MLRSVRSSYFSAVVDPDSDNFESLRKTSKPKQNGSSKAPKAEKTRPAAKEGAKSPVQPSPTQGKAAVKSPPVPVTPKSAPPPPQPKHTPTSVLDYFGGGSVQRSDKKLVASAKRKAVSTEAPLHVLYKLSHLCLIYTSPPPKNSQSPQVLQPLPQTFFEPRL